MLAVVYFLARGGDEDDEDRGILGVLIDLLSWWQGSEGSSNQVRRGVSDTHSTA